MLAVLKKYSRFKHCYVAVFKEGRTSVDLVRSRRSSIGAFVKNEELFGQHIRDNRRISTG